MGVFLFFVVKLGIRKSFCHFSNLTFVLGYLAILVTSPHEYPERKKGRGVGWGAFHGK